MNTLNITLCGDYSINILRNFRCENDLVGKTLHFYMSLEKEEILATNRKRELKGYAYLGATKESVKRRFFSDAMEFHTITYYTKKYGRKIAEKVYENGLVLLLPNPYYKRSPDMRLMEQKVFEYNLKKLKLSA